MIEYKPEPQLAARIRDHLPNRESNVSRLRRMSHQLADDIERLLDQPDDPERQRTLHQWKVRLRRA